MGWLPDLLFSNVYGLIVTAIPIIAAIPYAIWQGVKKLNTAIRGGHDGDSRTGP
jgi:hypothetical protein